MNPNLKGNLLVLSRNHRQVQAITSLLREDLRDPDRIQCASAHDATAVCNSKDFRVLVVPFELPIPKLNGVQLIRKLHRAHQLPDHVVLACINDVPGRFLQRLPVPIEIVSRAWENLLKLRKCVIECMGSRALIIHRENRDTSEIREVLKKKFGTVYSCGADGIKAYLADAQRNLMDLVVFADMDLDAHHAQDVIDELLYEHPRFPKRYIIMVGPGDELVITPNAKIAVTVIGQEFVPNQFTRIVDTVMR